MSTPDESRRAPLRRGLRLGTSPTRSVVVASRGERGVLERCLEALLPRCAEQGVEVVVVRAETATGVDALVAAYPSVRFVAAAPDTPIPDLRVAGMEAAGGDLVFLMDDEGPLDSDWPVSLSPKGPSDEQ